MATFVPFNKKLVDSGTGASLGLGTIDAAGDIEVRKLGASATSGLEMTEGATSIDSVLAIDRLTTVTTTADTHIIPIYNGTNTRNQTKANFLQDQDLQTVNDRGNSITVAAGDPIVIDGTAGQSVLQLGNGGLTPNFNIGDVFLRGNSGNTEIQGLFASRQFRWNDTANATQAYMEFDTGKIVLGADPTIDLGGATKQYSDRKEDVFTIGTDAYCDYVVDGTDDQTEINQAITDLNTNANNSNNRQILEFRGETFTCSNFIDPQSNVYLRGNPGTVITGAIAGGQLVADLAGSTDWGIENMTFDLQNTINMGAWFIRDSVRGRFKNLRFINASTTAGAGNQPTWYINLDTSDPSVSTITNFDNVFEDIVFDGHLGSLEMFVVSNAQDTRTRGLTFKNKTGSGPVMALFQNCIRTYLDKTSFVDCDSGAQGCIYITTSCHDVYIDGMHSTNTGQVIRTGFDSDNGTFGSDYSKNIQISNTSAIGGANSTSAEAYSFASTDGMIVKGLVVEAHAIGVNFNQGQATINRGVKNVIMDGFIIRNCNPNDALHDQQTGIFFSGVGGSQDIKVSNGHIYDDTVAQGQRHPVGFDGAFTWSDIEFKNVRLSPESGFAAVSITNAAALDNTVTFDHCKGYFNYIDRTDATVQSGAVAATEGVNTLIDPNTATTVTPPASPYEGMEFQITDATSTAASTAYTVDFTGTGLNGVANATYTGDRLGETPRFKYVDTTTHWILVGGA